jgi:thioredoxin 1
MADDKNETKEAREADANNFDDLMKESKPVLVDFSVTWCGPCQMMSPVIEELAEEEGEKTFIVAKLDIDSAPDIAAKYNVMSVPTFIIFKEGKEVDRIMGAIPKDAILEKIKVHTNK